jgi:nitrate/TMAO reductase-like tetraheme cytochrome c subunit
MSHNALAFLTNGHAANMPWGGSLDWAIIISILLSAFILAFTVATFFLYRGREFETKALVLGSVALVIAPLALLPVSTFAVLRYTKQEAFCTSCHSVMQPYAEDMRNPTSKTMAARHYQDRFAEFTECYSCHVNPGMYGMLQAKLTGLQEAYLYATGHYRLPLKMDAPFSNRFCLRCHAGTRKFMAEDSHLEADGKIDHDLLTGTTRCEECHGPGHQLAEFEPKARLQPP